MGGEEGRRCAEINRIHVPGARMGDQRFQQPRRDPVKVTAIGFGNEHLAESRHVVADVDQGDGTDHPLAVKRDPELAGTGAVEAVDVPQVRLIVIADLDAEFVPLNRYDEIAHPAPVRVSVRRDDDRHEQP